MNFRHSIIAGLVVIGICFPIRPSMAACSNNENGTPGQNGEVEYFADDNVLRYCDNTNWINMVPPAHHSLSLVGHWKLDETSGIQASDSSRFSNVGTLNGGLNATNSVVSISGRALNFDDTDDYINIPRNSAFEPASAITVSVWVYWDGSGPFKKIVSKAYINTDPPHQSYALGGALNANQMQFEVNVNGTLRSTPAFNVPTNQWVHILGRWQSGGAVQAYLNGTLISQTSSYTGTIPYYATPLNIGRGSNAQPGTYFSGRIDDVRIYSKALSPTEITQLYTERDNSLIGHWKLDTGSGSDIYDSSAYQNDGDLLNGRDAADVIVSAKIGNGVLLDGIADQVYVPSAFPVSSSKVTTSAWIKADSWGDESSGCILCFSSGSLDHLQLRLLNDSGQQGLRSYIRANNGDGTANTHNAITLDQWHHVAVTYDVSTDATPHIFVDGQEVGSYASSNPTGNSINFNGLNLRIGADGNINRFFDGIIDDVRLYSRVLTAAEIKGIASCTKPKSSFYNSDDKVMQWCDHRYEAHNMGVANSGTGGCTSPAAPEGSMNYSSGRYRFCDDGGWVNIGK